MSEKKENVVRKKLNKESFGAAIRTSRVRSIKTQETPTRKQTGFTPNLKSRKPSSVKREGKENNFDKNDDGETGYVEYQTPDVFNNDLNDKNEKKKI